MSLLGVMRSVLMGTTAGMRPLHCCCAETVPMGGSCQRTSSVPMLRIAVEILIYWLWHICSIHHMPVPLFQVLHALRMQDGRGVYFQLVVEVALRSNSQQAQYNLMYIE